MIVAIIMSAIIVALFKRHFPVFRVENITNHVDVGTSIVVDVRDYIESHNSPIERAINVPVAYLNRFYSEIPKSDLIVVASNRLERNLAIRFLRKRDFKVVGYLITNQTQTVLKENQLNKESYC